jgi:hypothetical protein
MGLSGAIGDAWEILANVVGKRGYPGSCALKAPPIQDGHVGTSGASVLVVLLFRASGLGTGGVARDERCSVLVVLLPPVVTTVALEK